MSEVICHEEGDLGTWLRVLPKRRREGNGADELFGIRIRVKVIKARKQCGKDPSGVRGSTGTSLWVGIGGRGMEQR